MTQDSATLSPVRPTRRVVTRTAVWTVPVIAAATTAPAYAASPCNLRVGQVLDWDGSAVAYTKTSATEAYAVLDPDAAGPIPGLRLDVKASYVGNMVAGTEGGDTSQTMTRQAAVGGLNVSGLGLMQATTSSAPNTPAGTTRGYGDRGTYTFTFSRAVSNLVFTITDIDSSTDDFRDALIISGGYVVESQAPGITAITNNNNQPVNWFQGADANLPQDDTAGSGGNLRIKFAGPISTFSITYWNRQTAYDQNIDTNQRIFVSDMTFDYRPC
ncbi:hypothetical protein [Nocardioides baculatus]|uniref:Uncharacterized protein n=1 Tax=Nocardioides baculatus TaxID=2801337 RepID=A0ABS1LBZ7_9ACTN|nr:hypothetical protein [Nocardioides baculatus]MBL0749150.1 hypothetical protein [Nocardioides baculatus]